jgi:hypothetical protein
MELSVKDILQAWNFKILQEFSNIIQHIRNNGKTIEDVLNYIESVKNNTIPKEDKPFIEKPIKICPCCKGGLKIFSLNKKEL